MQKTSDKITPFFLFSYVSLFNIKSVLKMGSMNVIIASPYGTNSLHGNTITAQRIASILNEAGFTAPIITNGDDIPPDSQVCIALHARKSAASVRAFLDANPTGKLIVFLTGTDLYIEIPSGCPICHEIMGLAQTLVVSQEASLESVPELFKSKTKVVNKSIQLPKFPRGIPERGLFTVISHLREVKQPFMAAKALSFIDDDIQVKLLGKEIDSGSAGVAKSLMHEDERFEWIGECDHKKTLGWIQRSMATINTSLSEGGANSVGESIVLGVPVLASKIEGNVGLLGADYDGYFSSENPEELANLMHRVMNDDLFLNHLKSQIKERAVHFNRGKEMEGWITLITSKREKLTYAK